MKNKWIGLVMVITALTTGGEVIDRIAAVVNEEIILLSEVEEKMFLLQTQGQLQGRDSTEVTKMRRELLDRLIEEKLVVQRARSQGMETDPQVILTRVDEAMSKVRDRFGSREAFLQALQDEGITENMLQQRYESDIEQELLGQRIVGREVRSKVQITSDDVKRYFDENQDEIPGKPMEVHLRHLVIHPLSPAKEAEARNRMNQARERILNGESFGEVAKEMSDDPTRNRGGELGWFSPGDLDPDFQAAADTLELGKISTPVRSRFGFHLIELLEREGPRFHVRHILALVEVSPEDIARAREKAQAALDRIGSGESFEQVAKEVSDDETTRESGGDLSWTPAEFLLPQVGAVVDSLKTGDVSPVVETDRGFHVFKLQDRRKGGAYEFEEIKDRLQGYLEQKELEKVYDQWLAGVRDSAYVEIKTWDRQ